MSYSSDLGSALLRIRKIRANTRRKTKRVLASTANRVVKKVAAKWPVDTGLSQAGWKVDTSKRNRVVIVNTVEYVRFVRRKGELKRGLSPLMERLVPRIMAEEVKNFATPRLKTILKGD